MKSIKPTKLKKGDMVRVIAPSTSMSVISEETKGYAKKVFEDDLGLNVSFGKNVNESDEFVSSSIKSRVSDIHDAFSDDTVKGIFTILGGYNNNQILKYIDWEVIKKNPKIICGFSDITAMQNSIYAKTNLITYSGPHYSTFGQKYLDDYTVDYLKKCLFSNEEYEIIPSEKWSDDKWFMNQEDRNYNQNEDYWVINEGDAEGTIIGGNLSTFILLTGTEFMPDIKDGVLFIEDDFESDLAYFDRHLQSILHLDGASHLKGILIGRFQNKSDVKKSDLITQIKRKVEIKNIPVLANVDFGHTNPMITFPIGGEVSLKAGKSGVRIVIR